ncbi:MAG: hypothetical protein ACYC7A_17865 [Thermoanaerobaculia bacterium]
MTPLVWQRNSAMISGGTLKGGGAIVKFDYNIDSLTIMAFDADRLSVTKQKAVILASHRQITKLFGKVKTIGWIYDNTKHQNYYIQPDTGKKVATP